MKKSIKQRFKDFSNKEYPWESFLKALCLWGIADTICIILVHDTLWTHEIIIREKIYFKSWEDVFFLVNLSDSVFVYLLVLICRIVILTLIIRGKRDVFIKSLAFFFLINTTL